MEKKDHSRSQQASFVHLHVHSEYSLLDGSINIKELICREKERGASHVALTDHGNMHACIDFYLEAKKNQIIPIIGCELFCSPSAKNKKLLQQHQQSISWSDVPFHLVALAKNSNGYKQLIKLVSTGYMGGQLQDVPIVPQTAFEKHNQELIVLSACAKGEFGILVQLLRKLSATGELCEKTAPKPAQEVWKALRSHVKRMHDFVGVGNYYIELIDNNLVQQKELIVDFVQVARRLSLPIVATADAHYLDEDFSDSHALCIAIKNGLTMNDMRHRLRQAKFHLRSEKEMLELFQQWPEAIHNTTVIAQQCSFVDIEMGKYYLPKIDLGTKESPKEALKRLAREGLEKRLTHLAPLYGDTLTKEKINEYWERLEYELKIIIQMGFPDYFLIVQDFIHWAKQQGIPVGPGRGSGAGSLVAYALLITDIDPIPYHLLFERFLNPERVSMPDFDIDFCQWRREEVIQYCIQKYGKKNVAQITTFGKMQAKGAVKSVGRALNLNFLRVDRFTKLFPPDLGLTLKDALAQEPRLEEEMAKDDALKECVDYALKLEGISSHSSVHAAGLVISDGDMTDYVPIYTTDGESYITQYEMKPTEKVGLVKFDFLGLKTLTVIAKAVEFVNKAQITDTPVQIDQISLSDKRTYQMLSRGSTTGVFQVESLGMTQLVKKLKPSRFEDIIALVALFRPGPLGSGMVDDFVERKHGRQEIRHQHPLLEPILEDTYGMILYQEQVQKIAATLASYSLGEADLLRRAMGKKIPEEMAKQKDRFLSGAQQNNIDPKLAENIFDLMAEFAKYGFNKSHSAAYGLVSYQTAYLKCYFPEHFLAAAMTCDLDNTDKMKRYIEECRALGIALKAPCLNKSGLEFSVPKKGVIYFGLLAIKGIGEQVVKPIIEERQQQGAFSDFTDFVNRLDLSKVGKKTLQLLIETGALDCFGVSRKTLLGLVLPAVNYSSDCHVATTLGQRSLFEMVGTEESTVSEVPWNETELLAQQKTSVFDIEDIFKEKALLGAFISAHPMDYYAADVNAFGMRFDRLHDIAVANPENRRNLKKKVEVVALFSACHQRRTKKGSLMASIRLEQSFQFIESVMFERDLEKITLPSVNEVVLLTGHVDKDVERDSLRFQIEKIEPIEHIRQEKVKKLFLKVVCHEQSNPLAIKEIARLGQTNQGSIPLFVQLEINGVQLLFSTASTFNMSLCNQLILKLSTTCLDQLSLHYEL